MLPVGLVRPATLRPAGLRSRYLRAVCAVVHHHRLVLRPLGHRRAAPGTDPLAVVDSEPLGESHSHLLSSAWSESCAPCADPCVLFLVVGDLVPRLPFVTAAGAPATVLRPGQGPYTVPVVLGGQLVQPRPPVSPGGHRAAVSLSSGRARRPRPATGCR